MANKNDKNKQKMIRAICGRWKPIQYFDKLMTQSRITMYKSQWKMK